MADLSADERAELERLRQQLGSQRGRAGRVGRWFGACALLLVAAILGSFAVVAVGALLAGPSAAAVAIRRLMNRGLNAAAGALGRAASWIRTAGRALAAVYHPLRVLLVLLAVAGFILADRPGISSVLWATLVVVGLLIVLEILVRAPSAEPATG